MIGLVPRQRKERDGRGNGGKETMSARKKNGIGVVACKRGGAFAREKERNE